MKTRRKSPGRPRTLPYYSVQALVAAGWTTSRIAARCGLPATTVSILRGKMGIARAYTSRRKPALRSQP